MANIDRNFLARPDFVVSTGEGGKTITIIPGARKKFVGEYEEETYNIIGWIDIPFIMGGDFYFGTIYYGESRGVNSITPCVSDNLPNELLNFWGDDSKRIIGILNFFQFVQNNPIHINNINLRTNNEHVLPQQIVILTPNVFNGQSTRQVIDVASKKTAYQYQNGIITLNDCDIIISRNSTIQFVCSCDVPDGDQPTGIVQTPDNQLFVDITIDKYLSLEKALIENLKMF